MHKETRWAKEIIALQDDDGKWGWFHTLSKIYQSPITTEQALRRLVNLGYTIEDECIQKAVSYMNDCLIGKNEIPDRREKLHDWDIFTRLMLATWIRIFTKENKRANGIAQEWATIITAAFSDGVYNHNQYIKIYSEVFGLKPRGGRLVDFCSFYQISLLAGCLEESIESAYFDYVLNHETGIYYIYEKKLALLPNVFQSKKASWYLAAIELLSQYKRSNSKLQFVVDWLERNKNENGKWDMGGSVNDKVYFPLSDNWRRKEIRESDCTKRIMKLIQSLTTSTETIC